MLPFPAGCGKKGNEKRETKRNPMLLEPARSKKGNAKSGKSQNMLPFPAGCGKKGNEKRETKRNPMPLELARSKKGNVKRGKSQNMLPFPARNRQNKQQA